MDQCDLLLRRLQRGPITPLQALDELGIYRLSARILDLKRRGHNIRTEHVEVPNREGRIVHVARYELVLPEKELAA
mgnify:CR=1 FL=1